MQVKGGVAQADNRLMQGDQIITINGEDVRDATQEHVAELLKVISSHSKLLMVFYSLIPNSLRLFHPIPNSIR